MDRNHHSNDKYDMPYFGWNNHTGKQNHISDFCTLDYYYTFENSVYMIHQHTSIIIHYSFNNELIDRVTAVERRPIQPRVVGHSLNQLIGVATTTIVW